MSVAEAEPKAPSEIKVIPEAAVEEAAPTNSDPIPSSSQVDVGSADEVEDDDEAEDASDTEGQTGKASGYDKYLAKQARRAKKEEAKRVPNAPKKKGGQKGTKKR